MCKNSCVLLEDQLRRACLIDGKTVTGELFNILLSHSFLIVQDDLEGRNRYF